MRKPCADQLRNKEEGLPKSFVRKPGPTGGALIRTVVGFLRQFQIQLPIDSHILIAVSGGADSVGLAHLLVHYGRRVIDRSKIRLLHINHGWRADESDQDEDF